MGLKDLFGCEAIRKENVELRTQNEQLKKEITCTKEECQRNINKTNQHWKGILKKNHNGPRQS